MRGSPCSRQRAWSRWRLRSRIRLHFVVTLTGLVVTVHRGRLLAGRRVGLIERPHATRGATRDLVLLQVRAMERAGAIVDLVERRACDVAVRELGERVL